MSDSTDADALPESLEARLYEIHFDGDPAQRRETLGDLCRQHPQHAEALRERAAMLTRGDGLFGRMRDQLGQASDSERIGPFVVRSVLGQGGFGTVYLADQIEPVRRQVALKVLLPGRVGRRALQRFEGERQVLARLQHACIAKVYDAGATADGVHYFAMEPVEGKPVTIWCAAARMDIESRLRLFLRICAALQHAHQRGVVHRDIKPSNVLVHEEDGQPLPKVIDFGVAKLLEAGDGDDAPATRDGGQVGTPGYMSPEQAAGEDVDTRADVYALGVLLCELLTGQLPFARERLQSSSFAALARLLGEESPRRPSQILLEDPVAAESIAGQRRTTAAKLLGELRADLDWVVLKALAPKPDDRYPSVSALAEDVERYLRRAPVSVRERVASYWLRKFVARHRIGVIIAGTTLLALLTAMIGLIWGLGVVDRARRDAIESGRQVSLQRDAALASAYSATMAAAQLAMSSGDVRTAMHHLQGADPERRGWEWRYLAAQSDHGLTTVQLEREILDLAWIDDDRFLGFESQGEIAVWSAATGKQEHVLDDWSGTFRAFALDRERGLLVAANDRQIGLWDYRDGHLLRQLHEVDGDVRSLAWSPDRQLLAVGSKGGQVDLVRLDGGDAPRRLDGRETDASALAFVGDHELLIGLDSGDIERVDVRTAEVRTVLSGHHGLVDDLLVDVAGDRLFSASLDTTVCAWQLSTGRLLVQLPGQVRMRRLALSPDGQTLYASGGWSKSRILAWRTSTLRLLGRYNGHRTGTTGLALDPAGKRLVSSDRDNTLRFWSGTPPQSRVRLEAGRDARDLSVDKHGKRFATASLDGIVTVWDAHTLQQQLRLETGQGWAGCALGQDIVYVAGPVLGAFAIADGTSRGEGVTRGHYVERMAIDPQERWLVGGHDRRALIWKLPELDLRHVLDLPVGTGRVIYDVHTQAFVLGCGDSTLRWLDPERGVVIDELRLDEQDHLVGGIVQSGDLLVAGLLGGMLRWRRADGPLHTVATSTLGAAISRDGSRVATAGSDHSVRLWNSSTMSELLVLGDLTFAAVDVHFVDGGQHILALSHSWKSPTYVYVWAAPADAQLPR